MYFTARVSRGLPLHRITGPIREWGEQSLVNVISLKVPESEVGYNFSIFGTVLARDEVEYRCLYLFRREKDDAQIITSPVCNHSLISLIVVYWMDANTVFLLAISSLLQETIPPLLNCMIILFDRGYNFHMRLVPCSNWGAL